jgi:hypothetical protein
MSSQEVNYYRQIAPVVAFLEYGAGYHTTKRYIKFPSTTRYFINIIDTYFWAAKMPVLGFLGTDCAFLAAMLDELPPKPAHLVMTLWPRTELRPNLLPVASIKAVLLKLKFNLYN